MQPESGVGEGADRRQGVDAHRELPGLAQACRMLAAGNAAVVPNPAPMAYGLVATSAPTINALKRRRLDQNVGVSLHDRSQWQLVAPCIDLSPTALEAMVSLLGQRLTVLMPVCKEVPLPGWVRPAVRDGHLAAFNGRWDPTAGVWDQFPRLYGSSANITGEPPADSAAQALDVFGPDIPVVGSAGLDGAGGPRSASTMVRIDRAGRLHLHRTGAQDAALGQPPAEFLRQLSKTVGLQIEPT